MICTTTVSLSDDNFWTAGNKLSRSWRWDGVVTGSISGYNWGGGQPNNFWLYVEDCMVLLHLDFHRWHDTICYLRNYFICEMSV